MTICDELRASVLQAAVQGKLVKQSPEEGTGEELYHLIQEEKKKLIEANKIKKEKSLPEISDDEKLFDIPNSWRWVRIGEIVKKLTDGSHNPPPNSGHGYPVISAKNIKNGCISLDNVDRYTDQVGYEKENPRTNITRGDLIMGIIGGSIGNLGIYEHNEKVIAQRSIAIMTFMSDTAFALLLLKSSAVQNQLAASTNGSAQGGVYLGTLKSLVVPFPPLAEQRRIVTRVKELMAKIDELEKIEIELEELKKAFPGDMKAALLQAALQGKLTEQQEEDGTGDELYRCIVEEKKKLVAKGKIKKEKSPSEISDDEKMFEIPDNWKWLKFGEIAQLLDGEKKTNMQYPCLDAKYLRGKSDPTILSNGKLVRAGQKLILVDGENSGEVFTATEDGYMGSTFKELWYPSTMNESYVLIFLLFHKEDYRNNKKGAAIPHLNKELFFNMPFPLPPLAEQKRIVEKLDKLLPLCDGLLESKLEEELGEG